MKKLLPLLLLMCRCGAGPAWETFPKIDAHIHIHTFSPDFPLLSQGLNFKLITICTGSEDSTRINKQKTWAMQQQKRFPHVVAWITTFSMQGWGTESWQQNVIDGLKKDFAAGAVGVKVWKDIGMTFRNPDGSFVFIDDPRFDPILDFISSQGKTLVGHLGEPRNCWLPLDSMTVRNDSSYFAQNPQYHMYLHPDYPSYEQQIRARDNMLAKHPDLRFVGAHLGSLEWNVDELAARLDRFPNMAVDMAARICHFQVQDREKVRRFFLRYQDRLIYGTDILVTDNTDAYARHVSTWLEDWRYFTTKEELTSPTVRTPFCGLDLPKSVLKKIYHDNAVKWFALEMDIKQ